MILERTSYDENRVRGVLIAGPNRFQTVEPPWLDNEPFFSCVPEGAYMLEPHSTDKYPDTWALVGKEVGHWPADGKKRSVCVFHAGNSSLDTMGCILPGLEGDSDRVYQSRAAMTGLRRYLKSLGGDELSLEIVNKQEEEAMPEEITAETNVETSPSNPERGAARTITRTIGGWVVGLAMAGLAKIGLNVELGPEEMGVIAMAVGSIIVSPILAWLGKQNRQSSSPTGLIGNLF